MDYKKVLRLHYVNKLSGQEIALCCKEGSKSSVNEFLKRFRECEELSYPLEEEVSNELIESLLYSKPGRDIQDDCFRDFNKEDVARKLTKKGETILHIWSLYYSEGEVDGKKPMSYRTFCRRFAGWKCSKEITFHIKRSPGENIELDFAGKQLYLHDPDDEEKVVKVTIFVASLSYSDYFYALVIEGLSTEERVIFVVPGALAVMSFPVDEGISEREMEELESVVHLTSVWVVSRGWNIG